jgi:hypothetical protein
VHACCFSRHGRWLATAHRPPLAQQSEVWRSVIRVWDAVTSEPITLPLRFDRKITRLEFVAQDTQLLVEHWAPPEPPQRWTIDLSVNEGSAEDFLLRAELLSAQRSFLSGEAWHHSGGVQAKLSAEEALAHVTSVGPLRPLAKEDCRNLWLRQPNATVRTSPPKETAEPHDRR